MARSKTGRVLSKAEILGVGVFSPLPNLTSRPTKRGPFRNAPILYGLNTREIGMIGFVRPGFGATHALSIF